MFLHRQHEVFENILPLPECPCLLATNGARLECAMPLWRTLADPWPRKNVRRGGGGGGHGVIAESNCIHAPGQPSTGRAHFAPKTSRRRRQPRALASPALELRTTTKLVTARGHALHVSLHCFSPNTPQHDQRGPIANNQQRDEEQEHQLNISHERTTARPPKSPTTLECRHKQDHICDIVKKMI